jgi:hypothetical protein
MKTGRWCRDAAGRIGRANKTSEGIHLNAAPGTRLKQSAREIRTPLEGIPAVLSQCWSGQCAYNVNDPMPQAREMTATANCQTPNRPTRELFGSSPDCLVRRPTAVRSLLAANLETKGLHPGRASERQTAKSPSGLIARLFHVPTGDSGPQESEFRSRSPSR